MTKSYKTETATGDITNSDLRARLHFCAETGQIWFHEHRMLLVHSEAQATLRWEMIELSVWTGRAVCSRAWVTLQECAILNLPAREQKAVVTWKYS